MHGESITQNNRRTISRLYGMQMLGYKETPQEMAQIVCDWEASSEEK